MQQGAALAVRGAPEPGRAVLAAREQALAVRAQAEPVDAPAVLGADPQRRPAASHPAGGGTRRLRPLGRGAPTSTVRAAACRGHRGGPGRRASAGTRGAAR